VTSRQAPRILLVDDHVLLSESLALALRGEGMAASVAELTSPEDLVARVTADPPDLVLLDLELGGDFCDGTALVRPFVKAGARVLVVSASRRRTQVGTAIELGAVGYLPKSVPLDQLLASVIAAARGDTVMTPEQRQALLQDLYAAREKQAAAREPFTRLTAREQKVLRELGNGKPVATIAAEWFVSEATVRTQVRGVLTKLGVGSQLEAVGLAIQAGWLQDPRRRRTE
jgi:DNA-binding NarL/FixJ family response regulator